MNDFVSHVKSALSEAGENKFTTSALSSFLSSARTGDSDCLTEDDLRQWEVRMILSGFKKTTRKRYFGKLNNVYQEWSTDGQQNPFGKVADAINGDFDVCTGQTEANLEIVQRLLKKTKDSIGWEYINVFLYLLYDVEATLEDVIDLTFDDRTLDIPQIDDIVDAMRGTKQLKYVFGLNRGAKRMPQLKRELVSELEAVLCMAGMNFGDAFSRDSITAIWVAAALNCRIPIADIRSMVKVIPEEYAFLSIIKPKELSEERKASILKTVADSINNKANQWFVMRMRSGNTPDIIKKAIKEKAEDVYEGMMFYYPTHEVFREGKNKKRIREEVPYIPGILFFKTRPDRVAPLFNKIGDLAWCYRYANTDNSPYSTISRHEMEKFQRHIGKFTDDIKVELVTEEDDRFAVDDVVKINGGLMAGNIGVITAVHNQDGTTTYSLKLSAKSSCRWTVAEVEDILVEPTPKKD